MVVIGAPNHFAVSLQLQSALVGQGERTLREAWTVCVCVPAGLAIIIVHDQVAVILHAQARCT